MTFLDQKTAMLRSIQLLHIYKEFTIVFFLSVQIKSIEKIIKNDQNKLDKIAISKFLSSKIANKNVFENAKNDVKSLKFVR